MSLLVDPDYAIHALRLAYLRRIDDHAGPRVITLPSISHLPQTEQTGNSSFNATTSKASSSDTFADVIEEYQRSSSPTIGGISSSGVLTPLPANSHVVIAGLNDARYQPELARLHSPKLNSLFAPRQDSRADLFGGSSETTSARPNPQQSWNTQGSGRGKNNGGLKYTTTILGPGRTGALGMRVSGRRAMSGDTPRRAARGSQEDDFVEEQNAEDITYKPFDDAVMEESVDDEDSASMLKLAKDSKGKSHRSSSFRIPNNDPHSFSSSSIRGFRNRSSSQPHHSATSDSLKAEGMRFEDEVAFSDESQVTSRSISDQYAARQETQKSVVPPSRPPRRVYKSDLHRLDAQQEEVSEESIPLSRLSTTTMPNIGSSVVHLRRRSASEGAAGFFPGSVIPDKSGESSQAQVEEEETEEMSLEGENGEPFEGGPAMNRTNSNSTLFSLASPPMTRRRGLSDNWQRGEGLAPSSNTLSPLSSNKMSLHSYKRTGNQGDSSLSRSRTNESSPFLRKAMLSGSMDASDSMDTEGMNASDGSSIPLDNSIGADSSGKEVNLLHPSTNRLPGEEFDGNVGPSSLHYTAPLSSALGLQTSWSGDQERHSDHQQEVIASSRGDDRGRATSPPTHRQARKDQSVSQRPPGHEAQQKQEWFASLKADPQTVAKRFETRSQRSGISALMNKHSQAPSNPFASLYKGVAGGSVSTGSSTIVEVYFPFASNNHSITSKEIRSGANAVNAKKKSMSLNVRKDATMEDVIGYSLYCYTEEDWQPRLEEGFSEQEREIRLSTVGWTLRIVEDGEVDDDYPAIDRTLTVGRFGADELAVCEATAAQVRQHLTASSLVRGKMTQPKAATLQHPATQVSSTTLQTNNETSTLHANTPAGVNARLAAGTGNLTAGSLINVGGTPIFASSVLSKSAMGPSSTSLFLRILITPNSEVKYKTTLQVPSDMYLADVLETICRKRHLANIDEWALVVAEKDVVVPLDRTVESLQGVNDLALVRRQDLGEQAGAGALTGHSTNPNASIFKRLSEPLQVSRYNAAKEIASTYKTYTVNRKQASFLGRHERNLTIDGDWIHIIPTDTRAFQTQSGTSSFPITAIISCTQSRLPSSFKLIVARESDQKRYEFEAESSKVAAEIVEEINSLIKRTK